MKKILAIFFALALLAGCGGGGGATSGVPVSGSIEDLVKMGKNYRCELQFKEGDQITSGTTYISGSSARSDYKMTSESQTFNGHMILTTDSIYTWVDEMPNQAIKLNAADMKKFQGEAQAESAGADSYSEKFDYKCFTWTPDKSKFTPPSDVKFTDYSAFMNQIQSQFQNLNTSVPKTGGNQCSVCDSISDANTKSMCKQQMGCK